MRVTYTIAASALTAAIGFAAMSASVATANEAPVSQSSTQVAQQTFDQTRTCKRGFRYSKKLKRCVRRKRGSYRGSRKS